MDTVRLKFRIAKNVQNSARFRTTFKFEREYLWNGWRSRKAVNGVINDRPFCVEQKNWVNFGRLTTTVSWLMSPYPKSTLRVLLMLMR